VHCHRNSTTKAKTNGRKAAKKSGESKTAKVVAMLQRASGCTREEVLALTGWKAVSMQQVAESAGVKLKMEKVEGKPIRYRA
jgi:hypothetical protein